MFTSFREKQERYSAPKPSLKEDTAGSSSTFNEINKPQNSFPSEKVNDNIGHIMFTENGGSTIPASATIPGPYPSPPPPTVYSFTLAYNASYCGYACAGSPDTTYYSTSSTLGTSSKLYTDSGLTTPVSNGYYSEGLNNNGNCYSVSDSLGIIDSASACVTCWQYTFTSDRNEVQFTIINCFGFEEIIVVPPFTTVQYCTNNFNPSTDGPCTL
jgi:hypothetical protein